MTNTSQFLPPTYEVPKAGGNYMKLAPGNNVVRILSTPILGWEDWKDNKPLRFPMDQKPEKPVDPKRPIKHFWAFIVWDYAEGKLKVMEITQSTIQESIKNLYEDIDWGDPRQYDIDIKKTGEKMETKYSIIAKPPKPITQEIKEKLETTNIDLTELYKGADPFGGKAPEEGSQSGHVEDNYIDSEAIGEKVDQIPF